MEIRKCCDDCYDVIVIGSGMGGLICANYLSKSGMKILLVEQHFQPGGCCTSFKRKGFTFDAGGHFFGNYKENGIFRRIIEYLDLAEDVRFIQADPVDHLIFPDFSVSIYRNFDKTVQELQCIFPGEKDKIVSFVSYLRSFNFTMSFKLKNSTFKDILDSYFDDSRLKAVFDIMLLYIGLPASEVSAVAGVILYRDFILDGGYYPSGGMQAFSNVLAKKVADFGGDVLLSKRVKKIDIANAKVVGITLEDGKTIGANFVVSNADAIQTYVNLVGVEYLENGFVEKLKSMEPSVSHFNVYLGIKADAASSLSIKCNTWYIPSYDIDRTYNDMMRNPFQENGFVHLAFPSFFDGSLAPKGCESLFLTVLAPYKTLQYWKDNRDSLCDLVIKRACDVIPGLLEGIVVKETSTPYTIERYTGNSKGANYGWAMNPWQTGRMRMDQKSPVKGLYLAGHWTQPGAGLATAAQSGYQAAKMILQNKND